LKCAKPVNGKDWAMKTRCNPHLCVGEYSVTAQVHSWHSTREAAVAAGLKKKREMPKGMFQAIAPSKRADSVIAFAHRIRVKNLVLRGYEPQD
jgi:hypothetical protein